MKPGTPEHKRLFCTTFIDSHKRFEPADLAWPALEPRYLERLRTIPFWGTARGVESRAGIMVGEFAQTIEDPLIREAMQVQAIEETRHARLMQHLIERYRIPAKDVTVEHRGSSLEEFVTFGYEECLDSFLGFGLFSLGRKIQYFPEDFLAIFDTVLFEEARHVTFFVNWIRYEEVQAGRAGAFQRTPAMFANYGRALKKMVDSFSGDVKASGFAATGAGSLIADLTPQMFLEAALTENRRYMSQLDPQLIKPGLLPALATVALVALRTLPPRKPTVKTNGTSVAGAAETNGTSVAGPAEANGKRETTAAPV
jgi:hypothetical protein